MTIHKSKGLQFKAVLLPYVSWEIDRKKGQSDLLWCSPKAEPFNRITPLPVPYSEKLKHTHLASDYIQEKLLRYVDNLNLLYVALTRAEDVLMVWCPFKPLKKERKEAELLNIAELMKHQVHAIHQSATLGQSTLDEETDTLEWGEIPTFPALEAETKKAISRFFKRNPFENKLKIHPESHLMATPSESEKALEGKWLHKLMEQIETLFDVEKVIQSYRFAGQIDPAKTQWWIDLIQQKLSQSNVKEWFEGKYRIHAETTILTSSSTYRPDRVMTLGTEAIVIDYKFGDKHHADHQQQVVQYMRLLGQMGYSPVKGYVWYFNEDDGVVAVIDPQSGSTPLFS